MTKKQKGTDYSRLLIISAALVTVVRYSGAFIASDIGEIEGVLSSFITVLMGISGLGMGILDVYGTAYLFDGWRRGMPASGRKWSFKFKTLTVFVFLLIITGVMILVPFTMSRVRQVSMAAILTENASLGLWALMVNIAPYLLIGGVAVGNQVVTIKQEQTFTTQPNLYNTDRQVAGKFPATGWNDWRKVPEDHRVKIASMPTDEIVMYYGILPRTARGWRVKAQEYISS